MFVKFNQVVLRVVKKHPIEFTSKPELNGETYIKVGDVSCVNDMDSSWSEHGLVFSVVWFTMGRKVLVEGTAEEVIRKLGLGAR